jgi:flagellar biogenesis protein FliO
MVPVSLQTQILYQHKINRDLIKFYLYLLIVTAAIWLLVQIHEHRKFMH